MFKTIKKDIAVIFERDPAAKSVFEVIFCYQGLHAIWLHRIAHYLFKKGWIFWPRLISNFARFITGIEIHPGATISEGLFIDHGAGTQPTIGDNVVVASGAKVLGSFTVGHNAKIGAGSVVLKEVPPYATVVGIPGKVVLLYGEKVTENIDLAHDQLPDPDEEMIQCMHRSLLKLEEKVKKLEKELKKYESESI